jgi:bisphosphoglycerate-independent phosphoglycerate mutase (AlkP superfamily)
LIASDLVPGVLLANRKISVEHPSLLDVAPTILGEFGIPQPATMKGKRLFSTEESAGIDRQIP